ncbi:MAG: glycerol-3-phosphate acyltransferase [Anaerolineales bacterium]|nr:glycerol-3-phosphate acyltransferase [Anaerolineales bacterium]
MELFLALLGGYLLGSIPFGVVYVRLFTGKDIRQVGSGRTGGTNAMRAGGFWVGLATALSDVFKATVAVWLAGQLLPAELRVWGMVLAGLGAILGHNYPVWLRFKGGAGGATAAGAAIAIWPWLAPIALGVGAFILYFIGYASVATIVTALVITGTLIYLAVVGTLSGTFIWFGVGSVLLLAWALRANFARLARGEERLVGRRAKRRAPPDSAGPA